MIEAVPDPSPEKLRTKLVPVETETEAMRKVYDILSELPFGARMRIVRWLAQRFQDDKIDSSRGNPVDLGEFPGPEFPFPRGAV